MPLFGLRRGVLVPPWVLLAAAVRVGRSVRGERALEGAPTKRDLAGLTSRESADRAHHWPVWAFWACGRRRGKVRREGRPEARPCCRVGQALGAVVELSQGRGSLTWGEFAQAAHASGLPLADRAGHDIKAGEPEHDVLGALSLRLALGNRLAE